MEEEISLRELIEVILKYKKTIIIVTLAATLVAAVFSFFIIKPAYEATTTLSVTDVTPATGFLVRIPRLFFRERIQIFRQYKVTA